MKVKWLGQACFSIVADDGTRIRTDPFDASLGFPISSEPADIVTVSHDHFDHAAVDTVPGNPTVIQKPGTHQVRGITFLGMSSFHDTSRGLDRGKNLIFCFEVDGVRLCHLGDLGHMLGDEQVEQIGKVGVLFIPVGGTYTIDAGGATEVVKRLAPRITVPMHYKTGPLTLPIDRLDRFLEGKPNVETLKELEVNAESLLPVKKVVVLTL